MKILVFSDISGAAKANPFTCELIKSLAACVGVDSVEHGTFWLESDVKQWDLVILQWPELIIRKGQEASLKLFVDWMGRVASSSVILSIVHNLTPHYRDDTLTKKLYDVVNDFSDAFIHLGDTSVEQYPIVYPAVFGKPTLVVPHGNYSCFGTPVDTFEARRLLNIRCARPVVVVLGELRAKEEFDLMLACARFVREMGGTLLFAGRLPIVDRGGSTWRVVKYASLMLRIFYYFVRSFFVRGLVVQEREIPNSLMAAYLGAADVLLIPRISALNSGNVSLGFTFGRVVVGPDIGNIGSELRKYGNPVFEPRVKASLRSAIREGVMLSRGGVGQKNRDVALSKWSWNDVGKKITDFSREISKLKSGKAPGG